MNYYAYSCFDFDITEILNDIRRTIYEMIDSRNLWIMDDGLCVMDYGLWWNVCG